MQYTITLNVTADGDIEAFKMARHFLSSPAVTKVTVNRDGDTIAQKENEKKSVEITCKVFAPDTPGIRPFIGYTNDGCYQETEPVGNHRGEDVKVVCDAGTQLIIGCAESEESYFITDESFDKKQSFIANEVAVYVSGKEEKGFVMIDTHLDAKGNAVHSLQIANGCLKGEAVTVKRTKMSEMTA